MKKLDRTLFLEIKTEEELRVISEALDMMNDMVDDLALDALPISAQVIRKLAGASDDEIKRELREIHKETSAAIDRLLVVREMEARLRTMINPL